MNRLMHMTNQHTQETTLAPERTEAIAEARGIPVSDVEAYLNYMYQLVRTTDKRRMSFTAYLKYLGERVRGLPNSVSTIPMSTTNPAAVSNRMDWGTPGPCISRQGELRPSGAAGVLYSLLLNPCNGLLLEAMPILAFHCSVDEVQFTTLVLSVSAMSRGRWVCVWGPGFVHVC